MEDNNSKKNVIKKGETEVRRDKKDYILAFNKLIYEVLESVSNVLPEYQSEIKKLIKYVKFTIKFNKSYFVNNFKIELKSKKKLLDYIKNKDDNMIIKTYGNKKSKIRKLIIVWLSLSEHNKSIVWQYINLLIRLLSYI
jgi:hypothetical protein